MDIEHCNHGCITGLGASKIATLSRNYYPEGNWGWIIVVAAVLNSLLNHGLQLSAPVFLNPAGKRFHEKAVNSLGEFLILFYCAIDFTWFLCVWYIRTHIKK